MEPIFVYVTCKDRTEAKRIASVIVKAKLAACANIIDGMESIYWWEGEIESGQESILIFKTIQGQFEKLSKGIKELHSYSVPCIIALPISNGNQDYIEWIQKSVDCK